MSVWCTRFTNVLRNFWHPEINQHFADRWPSNIPQSAGTLVNKSGFRVDQPLTMNDIIHCIVEEDEIRWQRHQMEQFSALLDLCAGTSPVTGEFPTQRPMTRSLMFCLICAWINDWVNNRDAGDLRRHRAHYDVIVMFTEVVACRVGHICPRLWTSVAIIP